MLSLAAASREALSEDGALARQLDAFTPRAAQLRLAEAIADAFQQRDTLLAEAALLLGDHDQAETLARRAFETGSKVGPLCRRHWATVERARLLDGDAAGASAAKAQIGQCAVAGVNRF